MPSTERTAAGRQVQNNGPAAGGIVHDPISHISAVEVRSAELEVYEALRREIIHGVAPGTPLRLAPLAERFQVSTMPVRSAIARLESDGLIVQRPRRGAVVTDLTHDDFTDMYAIRVALEGVAARCGCPVLTDEDLTQLREVYLAMTEFSTAGLDVIDQYLALEWRLHDICYAASQRPRLLRLIDTYRRNAERYFRLYLREEREFAPDVDHQGMFLAACENRDGDRAEAAIRMLFDWTAERVLPVLAASAPG